MFLSVLSLPCLTHWARIFFMHFPSLLMNYVKDLGTASSAAPPSCWVTSFILSSQPFSARALDIFTSHVTLHAFELNLLMPYWSLPFRPFHSYACNPPLPSRPLPSSPLLSYQQWLSFFLACIWREGGRMKWKRSESRSIHVVIVWDGSCQRWQFETLDPQKWILGQGQVTAQSNSFFWNV